MSAKKSTELPLTPQQRTLLAFAGDFGGILEVDVQDALDDATGSWNELLEIRAWRADLPEGPEGRVLAHASSALLETLQQRVTESVHRLDQYRSDYESEIREYCTAAFRRPPDGLHPDVRAIIAAAAYADLAVDAARSGQTAALEAHRLSFLGA